MNTQKFSNSFLTTFLVASVLVIFNSGCEKKPEHLKKTASADNTKEFKFNLESSINNASLPNIFKDEQGSVWLSYVSRNEAHTSLWLTQWSGDQWSEPERVAQGENWFVNWADFPSVVKSKNSYVAHWLQKNGSGTYAYGVQYATKQSSGDWETRGLLHSDTSQTEHGFVSLQPDNTGTHAVWLDGRNMQQSEGHSGHSHDSDADQFDINNISGMALRYGLISNDSSIVDRQELDSLTCDCCQTSAVMTKEGLVVAYRDRVVQSANSEIRDIKILRKTNSGWEASQNTPVDNWYIQACPVNGPVLSARGNQVAMAWFTAANNQAKVKVVFSSDNGKSFADSIEVDSQNNLGRVGLAWLDNENAVVSWIGMRTGNAQLLSRVVNINGQMQEIENIASIDMARGSGVPQLVTLSNSEILFAYTQTGKTPAILTRAYKIQ